MRVEQFLILARQRVAELRRALVALPSEFARHRMCATQLRQLREQTLDELAQVNVPTLAPATLATVERYTGYGRFRDLDLNAYLARERDRLMQRVAEISADPRFIRRQELLDPTAGELTLRLKQARDELALIESGLQCYEQEPDFLDLYRRGYRTPAYRQSWLSRQYYLDWKRGDEITEKFGCKSFSEVRAAYDHLLRGREVCRKTLESLEGEIEDVRRLIAELNEAQRRLNDLPRFVLEDFRRMVREHLVLADRKQLFGWAGGDRVRESLIKRLDGVEKQLEYTQAMVDRCLKAEQHDLTEAITKLERKVAKFSRPKYAGTLLDPHQVQTWLRDPRERLVAQRARFWRDYAVVAEYNQYDRYDFASDLLWWDVMTDGRLDGSFIPEVEQYRQQHPGYVYQRPTPFYGQEVEVS